MNRVFVIGALLLATIGCRAPMPKLDPFLPQSPQRIPPPATGTIRAAPDPYLRSPSTPLSTVPPVGGAIPAAGSGLAPTNTPPTQITPSGSLAPGRGFGVTTPRDNNTTATPPPLLAGMRINDATTPTEPQRFHATLTARDLPPSIGEDRSNPLFRRTSAGGSDDRLEAVVKTQWNSPISSHQSDGVAVSAEREMLSDSPQVSQPLKDSFSHDDDYARLRGQLQYEASKQRWRLRYIARDADDDQIDQFGGSVILHDEQLPDKYKSGDYVVVEGKLGDPSTKDTDFAPLYHVSRIVAAP